MDLSDLVSALRAPGTPDELTRAGSTVAAMSAAHAEAAAGVVPIAAVNRRPALVAAGATVGIVGALLLTGTAAAAFSGALPEGLQNAAHNLFGAPAFTPPAVDAEESESGSADGSSAQGPVGPGVSTDAASLAGLCQAFAGVASDDPQADSVAYRALASAAAAAAESVEDYCGEVVASGGKPSVAPSKKPTAKPTQAGAKPTAVPGETRKPTAKPSSTRKPSDAGAEKPSDAGAQKPSGVGAR